MPVIPSISASVVFLLIMLLSGPVAAFDTRQLSGDDERRLAAGEVLIGIRLVSDSSAHVTAVMHVPARRGTVWSVITNCERSPDYVPYLRSCRILERSANRQEDIRELIGEWGVLPFDLRSVVRSGYDKPRSIKFENVAGDLAGLNGEWRLESISRNTATRVIYEARLVTPVLLPISLMQGSIETDIPKVLNALRDEIIKQRHR